MVGGKARKRAVMAVVVKWVSGCCEAQAWLLIGPAGIIRQSDLDDPARASRLPSAGDPKGKIQIPERAAAVNPSWAAPWLLALLKPTRGTTTALTGAGGRGRIGTHPCRQVRHRADKLPLPLRACNHGLDGSRFNVTDLDSSTALQGRQGKTWLTAGCDCRDQRARGC